MQPTRTSLAPRQLARRAALGLALVFVTVGLSACKSIDPTPFQDFQKSLIELQAASDKVWEAKVQAEEKLAFATSDQPSETKPSDVMLLQDDENSFAWRMEKAPLYFVMQRNRKAFRDLSQAYVDYATLLVELTGGELTSPERFDELASSLNANARSGMDAMKASQDDDSTAIISTAAAQLLRGFIVKKQRSALKQALGDAQPALEAFAEEGALALDLMAVDLWTAYSDYTIALPSVEGGDAERKRVKELLARNKAHIAELESLQALAHAYGLIPKAHADLKKALDQENYSLTWIRQMHAEAQRLKKQAEELAAAPDGDES